MQISDLPETAYPPYYGTYIKAFGSGGLLEGLHRGRGDFLSLLPGIPPERLSHSYAEGKWTLAEVLVHIMDTERVFQYRALRFARNDGTELAGFDQDAYVPHSGASKRSLGDIGREYASVRDASISLFGSLDRETLGKMGVANGLPMGVGALGFIISGHQAHHLGILRERYLP